MRIAVTGGTGFVGQNLVRLYAAEHEFVVYTPREDSSHLHQSKSVRYFTTPRPEGTAPMVYDGLDTCDAAVNLGFARPIPGKPDTLAHYTTSLLSTDAFLSACADAGIRNVVHASSRLVYDEALPVPHVEDEPIRPTSYYGVAKAAAEHLAAMHIAKHGLQVKTLRFAQIIGATEKQGLVSVYLANAKAGKPLQVWGTGTESAHEYLYVDDACTAIMAAIAHPSLSGVYNVGSGEMVNALQVAQTIRDISGGSVEIEILADKSVPRGEHLVSSQKIRTDMSWEPQWPVARALGEMLDW